jgi:hypothetical protein
MLDLNNDSIIGSPYSTISTVGSLDFQKAIANNRYSVLSDGLIKPITVQGTPNYEGIDPSIFKKAFSGTGRTDDLFETIL